MTKTGCMWYNAIKVQAVDKLQITGGKMLISIKFSNFRSYYNQQEFSMLAIPQEKERYEDNSFAVNPALVRGRLLKTSMILGLNASGKSNLLRVCKYLRYLVMFSSQVSRDKRNIFNDANEQFSFFESAKDIPTNFEIEFIAENKYYFKYSLKIRNFSVEYESLYRRTVGDRARFAKLKCLYERKGDTMTIVSDEYQKLIDFIEVKSNVLILSNCNADIKEDVCPSGKTVINWFSQLNYWSTGTSSIEIYEENDDYLQKAANILRVSDKSLKSLKLKKTKVDVPIENSKDSDAIINALKKSNIEIGSGILAMLEDGLYQIDIMAEYNVYDNFENCFPKNVVEFSVFDSSSKISTGQAKLIKYFAYIIKVLQNGGILFLDELDSNLHHQFPKIITDAFNDNELNRNNAQLIFTTHSPTLLDNDFRRDQINIIKKDEFGISSVSHPARIGGRVKSTNSLSKLWLKNGLNEIGQITVEDLKKILI